MQETAGMYILPKNQPFETRRSDRMLGFFNEITENIWYFR